MLDHLKRREAINQMTTAELSHRDAMRSTDQVAIERSRVLCEESAISLTECKMEGQAKVMLKKTKELAQHILVVTGKRKARPAPKPKRDK